MHNGDIASEQPLNFRLFLAALMPLLIIAILFAAYTISTRSTDLSNNIQLMAQTRAAFASNEAGLALFSKDLRALKPYIDNALQLKATSGVLFLDQDANIVAASTGFVAPKLPLAELTRQQISQEKLYYYALPVNLSGIDFADYSAEFTEPGSSNDELAGWVVVALDISEQRSQLEGIVATTIVFAIIGFLAAVGATYYLSKVIVAPIQSLTRTVSMIKEGNLSARAEIYPTEELAILGSGINRMAEAISEGRETLEERVRDATQKLHHTLRDLQKNNQELEIARELSEQANQSKSEFLARMSHELRTPLTSIQGFARLLEESAINDADKQHCQVIDQAANQLLILIEDILDFSKLQSNTVVLEQAPFDLLECIEQVAVLFAQSAHEKELELLLDIEPEIVQLRRGDQKRVHQIINNLISNAIKFTNSGGVYIRMEQGLAPDQLIIHVRDTGIGIKETNRNQLFRAFVQADTSISRQFGGTGLGLSITKTLVDLMGGSLSFDSELGKGSTFTVALPLPPIPSAPIRSPVNQKVLVYPYNELAWQAANNLLKRLDYQAINAASTPLTTADSYPYIIHYLSPTAHLADDFPEQLLASRQMAPDSQLLIVTPVTNLHNLLSQHELEQLQPCFLVHNPPTISGIKRIMEHKLSSNAAPSEPSLPLLNKLNILIAEDNQFTCLLLETLIERHGGAYSTATNGAETVKICRREPFDIILIDVRMPVLNGIDAIQHIRSSGSNTETPIIALTADLLQQEEYELMNAGANEMLLKPLNENLLLEEIRDLTGMSIEIGQSLASFDSLVSSDLFYSELNSLCEGTQQALQEQDYLTARELIHQMLGITGVFSAQQLEEKVLALHQACKDEQYDQLESRLDAVREQVEKVMAPEEAGLE